MVALLSGKHGDEERKGAEQSHAIYVTDDSPGVYTVVLNYATSGSRSVIVYDGNAGFNCVRDIHESKDYRTERNLRLKGPGRHWTEHGATAVTALRAIDLNGKWNSFRKTAIMSI